MATLLQLQTEPYWSREIVTAELGWLGSQLCARTGQPPGAVGTKGNIAHLSGGHRSQEWIKGSAFCTDRFYTVQPNLTAAQKRHIAALDFTPGVWGTRDNRRKVAALTGRLVDAGRSGRLAGVTEIIGSFDGVHAVGTTLASGATWWGDPSHLDHVHKTFDRRRLQDRAVMERVLAVALGEDDDMATSKEEWLTLVGYDGAVKAPANWPSDNKAMSLSGALTELLARAVISDRAASAAEKAHAAAERVAATQTAALGQLSSGLATLSTLVRQGGGNVNVAAVIAKLDEIGHIVSGLQAGDASLVTAVDGLRHELAGLRTRLATAYGATEE